MRAVVQRVSACHVNVDGETVAAIEKGLCVLIGLTHADTEKDLDYILDKVVNLRIFSDENDKMNLSVKDVGGSVLYVSQFTLYGDARGGRRPSFVQALAFDQAEVLYRRFRQKAAQSGVPSSFGRYGADMEVTIVNDGPVTLLLDSGKLF